MPARCSGCTSAFQADGAGSIPVAGSGVKVARAVLFLGLNSRTTQYPALTTGLKPQGNADEIGAEAESCVPPKVGGIRPMTVRLTGRPLDFDSSYGGSNPPPSAMAAKEPALTVCGSSKPIILVTALGIASDRPLCSASPMEEAASSKGVQVSVRIRRGAQCSAQEGQVTRIGSQLNINFCSVLTAPDFQYDLRLSRTNFRPFRRRIP